MCLISQPMMNVQYSTGIYDRYTSQTISYTFPLGRTCRDNSPFPYPMKDMEGWILFQQIPSMNNENVERERQSSIRNDQIDINSKATQFIMQFHTQASRAIQQIFMPAFNKGPWTRQSLKEQLIYNLSYWYLRIYVHRSSRQTTFRRVLRYYWYQLCTLYNTDYQTWLPDWPLTLQTFCKASQRHREPSIETLKRLNFT